VALNTVQEFTGTAKVPDRLAVYDAAVNIDGNIDTAWLDGFEDAVNGGKVGHALAHMKKATSPGSRKRRSGCTRQFQAALTSSPPSASTGPFRRPSRSL
jgi:hypothetical protein